MDRESREMILAARFFGMTPFCAHRSIMGVAFFMASLARSMFLSNTSERTFFNRERMVVLKWRL